MLVLGNDPGPGVTLLSWTLTRATTEGAEVSPDQSDGYSFTLGTTLGTLRAKVADLSVDDDDTFGSTFTIGPVEHNMYGTLTGVTDADTVTSVLGGRSCGE